MKFVVLKEFNFGRDLKIGDILEIPDDSPKIGSLVRAKFIRFAGGVPPEALPTVKQVAAEIKSEEEMIAGSVISPQKANVEPAIRDPREIVRRAKAKAAAK